MPSKCVFEFNRDNPIYHSGETINGRISLTTTINKSIKEIYILFEGGAKVSFEHRLYRGNRPNKVNFRSNENYFSSRTNVFGAGDLPPGTQTYTYSIPLPLECPSSCVEKYGKIFYEVQLVIDRTSGYNNVFKQPLTVLQTYNLNMYADLLLPVKKEHFKYFCCFPCASSPVISTLTIPFGGYAPGQKINYLLDIDNRSQGYDIYGIEMCLVQYYEFKATLPHHQTRGHRNILATETYNNRVLRLSQCRKYGSLAIPPVPPSSRNNRIINISYMICMVVKTGGCHDDLEVEIPIVIGTIPLAQSADDPATVAQWIPQTPSTPAGAAADLPPSYDNCEPPSFEEATHIGDKFIDTDVNEHHRTDDFIPRYPMYTNFASPSAPPPETPDVPQL